jgi:transposase InsO family protein
MARDGVAVDPQFAAAVVRHVDGERFDVAEECRRLGVSRSRFYKYAGQVRAEGVDGLFPRSRRPLTSPTAVSAAVEDAVVRGRKELADAGWDAGADSIGFWLQDHPDQLPPDTTVPSRATINRILRRRGLAEVVPSRRPRRADRRFEATAANTRWQMDGFVVRLADGTKVVVLHILDDCSRLDLGLHVMTSENSREVWAGFLATAETYGLPREVLTDNGTAFSGRRRGWMTPLEENLGTLGVLAVTSTPGHPQTCGKVERAHKTVRKWLRKRSRAESAEQLQAMLETYRDHYNRRRRKKHLGGLTPAQRYALGPLDGPADDPLQPDTVISAVKVSTSGCISVLGHLVGIGRRHAGRDLTSIRRGRQIAIFDDHTLIAEIDLKPDRHYQPARVRQSGTLSTMS